MADGQIPRYLVQRHGDDYWVIVDRLHGFGQLGLFTLEAIADWICGLMNADVQLDEPVGRANGSRRASH